MGGEAILIPLLNPLALEESPIPPILFCELGGRIADDCPQSWGALPWFIELVDDYAHHLFDTTQYLTIPEANDPIAS